MHCDCFSSLGCCCNPNRAPLKQQCTAWQQQQQLPAVAWQQQPTAYGSPGCLQASCMSACEQLRQHWQGRSAAAASKSYRCSAPHCAPAFCSQSSRSDMRHRQQGFDALCSSPHRINYLQPAVPPQLLILAMITKHWLQAAWARWVGQHVWRP
jgi:hypothetical protein